MLDYQPIRPAAKTPSGIYHLELKCPSKLSEVFRFTGFFGGFSWTKPEAPGYVVLFGELSFGDENYYVPAHGRGELRILVEYVDRGLSLDKFFRKISDLSFSYGVFNWYADLTEPNYDNLVAFTNFMQNNGFRKVSASPGPYPDTPLLAVQVMKDWLDQGVLVLHETSALREQLRGLSKDDFNQPRQDWEAKFYAINGARFALGRAHQCPPRPPTKANRPAGWRSGDLSWMGA